MSALLVVLALFVVGAPILISLGVCAPKWLEARPGTHAVLTKERGGPSVRWVWVVPLVPVVALMAVVGWYVSTLVALIERKCPYTSPVDYKNQDTTTLGDIGDMVAVTWDYVRGR